MRDVGALVRTPGNGSAFHMHAWTDTTEQKKKKKKKENAPAEKKIDPPRRTSCEIEDLFARLELLPTSSPLPARPRIRREEELAVAAEELRKEKAAAAADKDKAARRLRPALTDKARNASTEGKKVLRVHVQTKAQRLDLGARGRAVAAELERRKGLTSMIPMREPDLVSTCLQRNELNQIAAVPATPPRPRRRLLDESLLTPTPCSFLLLRLERRLDGLGLNQYGFKVKKVARKRSVGSDSNLLKPKDASKVTRSRPPAKSTKTTESTADSGLKKSTNKRTTTKASAKAAATSSRGPPSASS
ncbi:hypothetical protein N0V86_007564 [Didymella sp. IMI 355093]|nr:hypothetical protein N0V86_007564 [Didymella sp. IMI 355093]